MGYSNGQNFVYQDLLTNRRYVMDRFTEAGLAGRVKQAIDARQTLTIPVYETENGKLTDRTFIDPRYVRQNKSGDFYIIAYVQKGVNTFVNRSIRVKNMRPTIVNIGGHNRTRYFFKSDALKRKVKTL
jgi:hypothetical protein